jgi:nitrogen regulatory protein P-II 1
VKKIEVIVQSEIAKNVVDAISKQGVGGVTLIQSLGKGGGERPWIGGEKGHQVEFNSIDLIITVVDDSKVDSIVSAIIDIAHTGQKGDGKIFISEISEAYDISTKQKEVF